MLPHAPGRTANANLMRLMKIAIIIYIHRSHMTMTDKLIGAQIGGFVVGDHVAEGGMGSVYMCHRPGSQDALAIKIMLPEHTEDDEYRERFEREAKTMQSLAHPHIMPVEAWGEENGVLYLVMPFVRGPSVFDLLGRRRF